MDINDYPALAQVLSQDSRAAVKKQGQSLARQYEKHCAAVRKTARMKAVEEGFYGEGFQRIGGSDEVGRGPLAGPVVCAAVILLIAFSRMYLGVHTPLDVGVSLVSGLALTLALWPLFRDIESHPGRMYAAIGAMLALTLAYLLYVELYPFPADTDAENLASALENGYKLLGAGAAMLLSYALDRKYIHFETKAPLMGQVLKCVIGLALVMGVRAVLKAPLYALFGNPNIADAARYFIMVFVAAAVWPMTFRFFARVGR